MIACPVLASYQRRVLGGETELDNKIARQVLRLSFSSLLPPQSDQRPLVAAHDDPGIGAPDEPPAIS